MLTPPRWKYAVGPPIAQETPNEQELPPGWRAMGDDGETGSVWYVNLNTGHFQLGRPKHSEGRDNVNIAHRKYNSPKNG